MSSLRGLATVTLLLLVQQPGVAESNDEFVLIDAGKPVGVHPVGNAWQQRAGFFEGSGVGQFLYADRAILAGDFHIQARLRMLNQRKSAAGFVFGDGFFGFEGAKAEELFLNGSLFGGYRNLGRSADVFKRGEWIDFEVRRMGETVRFLIDGKTVHTLKVSGGIDRFGFSPHRSTMQVSQFSVVGQTRKLPTPKPRGYSIPLIDLAAEKHRQVVVDREPGQYLGHPTTVLLEDNKTIIVVYPKGHGRGAIVMKRSTDAGKTWSDRLPVPKNWATSLEVPTIHRVIDSGGVKRLILFSGLYPIRMAVSEDDAQTWTPLKPIGDFGGIVTMGDVVRLEDGRYMALFHDDGRFIRKDSKPARPKKFFVYKTTSGDGGLTWSQPTVIAKHATAHLCEPGAVRSPDGKQLAVLLRENSRRHNGFVIFSDDEGETWTKPVELPGSLTGDRHTCRYAPDGRLVISFRDTTHVSRTKGDWVAWVGKYDDIVHGREGQYRVRLMDNHKGADCAYPGVEVLPDGTFVATTYGHWIEGEPPFVVSVRFTLAELDEKAARLKKPSN